MATIRFDELNQIPNLQDNDIIVVHDDSEGVTSKATVSSLKNILITSDVFSTNAESIISALNEYFSSGAATVQLNSALLDGKDSDYYVNYNNLTNTPTIPLKLSEMENNGQSNGGYLKILTNNTIGVQPITRDGAGNVVAGVEVSLSTDNLPQGVNNKYASDAVIESYFDREFSNYFNQLSPTFDRGFAVDSLTDAQGTFVQGNYLETGQIIDLSTGASNRIFIADTSLQSHYRVGDAIRVYGAGRSENPILNTAPASPANFTVSAQGFAFNTDDGVEATEKTFSYRLCFFDYTTGEISPASSPVTLTIYVPNEVYNAFGQSPDLTVYDIFNAETFISIQLSSIPDGQGILVYRDADSTVDDGTHRLVYVLGPKDIERATFIDYYNFDYGNWTEKREADNAYLVDGELRNGNDASSAVTNDGLIHFPISAPTSSLRGWVDTTINTIEARPSEGGFNLLLDNIFTFNTTGTDQRKCWVAHNDTALISGAIASASAGANKAINLNAKTYVIDSLAIPNNFGIVGVPYITRLKKLPWSGYATQRGALNNMLLSSEGVARAISISGVDIDGTSNLQFLMADASSENRTNNYIVDLGFQSESCLFDKVRIIRPVAGGVFASLPIDFKMTSSEVTDSGNTDRFEYTPLQADEGQNTVITNNRFANFTQYIDVSVTDKGIISGNIISNVGSGLLVYGSKFLITNPNTLVGPAGEFLPTPDILNAEYEAVNIDLNEAFTNTISGQDGTFIGPALTYQENGEIVNLNNPDGFFAELKYEAFMIEKTPEGSESVWTFQSGGNPDPAGTDLNPEIDFQKKTNANLSLGQFGFNITENSVKKIKGSYIGSGTDGIYSYKYLSGNLINPVDDLPYFDDYPYTLVDGNKIKTHVGLAWAAIYTRDVPVAVIKKAKNIDPATDVYIDATQGDVIVDVDGNNTNVYRVEIEVTDTELAQFSVGMQAALASHGQVVTSTGDTVWGTISGITALDGDVGLSWAIDITYTSASEILAGDNTGTLNIKNTFTLAQGRII